MAITCSVLRPQLAARHSTCVSADHPEPRYMGIAATHTHRTCQRMTLCRHKCSAPVLVFRSRTCTINCSLSMHAQPTCSCLWTTSTSLAICCSSVARSALMACCISEYMISLSRLHTKIPGLARAFFKVP